MNTRSIRFRLLVFYAALITAVFIALPVVTYWSAQQYLVKSQADVLVKRAHLVSGLLAQVWDKDNATLVAEVEKQFVPEVYGRFVRITDQRGKVLYQSRPPKDESFDPSLVEPMQGIPREGDFRKEKMVDGRTLLITATLCTPTPENQFRIEFGSSLSPVLTFLHQLLIIFLFVFPVAILVSIGGGYLLIRRALSPVERLAATAEVITSHNLSQRLPIAQTGDELEQLSLALNRMITRLEHSFQLTRRFSADASHELRTPLTIIRGELEGLMLNRNLSPSMRDSLGSLLEEAEHLHRIVEGLFALAKLDAGESHHLWASVNIAQLANRTVEQMRLLAEDKSITISCNAPEAVYVRGDHGRLKQVIVNLVDNAIKFTPSGGKVVVHAGARNGEAHLDVDDSGVGIAGPVLPRVFDRFFRADEARSRDSGGAGIGLSIVKSIVTTHGGTVVVESEPHRGSSFQIRLPRCTNEADLDTSLEPKNGV